MSGECCFSIIIIVKELKIVLTGTLYMCVPGSSKIVLDHIFLLSQF